VLKIAISTLLGGAVGGALVWFVQTNSFHLVPVGMTYTELAATLLSAVSVLVTILGVFVALLAIWGYSQFKSFAQSAAKEHVGSQLKDGEIRTHIEGVVEKFLTSEIQSENFRSLVDKRVDYVIYSGAEQRAGLQRKQAAKDELREDADEE